MKGNQCSQNKFMTLLDTYEHLCSLDHGSTAKDNERRSDINYKPERWKIKFCNRWSRTYKCLNASIENSSKVPPVTETLTSCQQDSAQSHDKHCQGNLKEAIAGREAHLP